jgi:hypothetical protein
LLLYTCDAFTPHRMVKSNIDGRYYRVATSWWPTPLVDYTKSADTLAYMNRFIVDVLRYVKQKYVIEKHVLNWHPFESQEELDAFLHRLINRYNPGVLRENVPLTTNNTSFVRRKGEEVAFCIKKEGGSIHDDIDTLQFVALHELTHIGTKAYGHGRQFWRNFKFVLHMARDSGHYDAVDYSKRNDAYCGLNITYNPLFDEALL